MFLLCKNINFKGLCKNIKLFLNISQLVIKIVIFSLFTNCLQFYDNLQIAWFEKLTLTYIPIHHYSIHNAQENRFPFHFHISKLALLKFLKSKHRILTNTQFVHNYEFHEPNTTGDFRRHQIIMIIPLLWNLIYLVIFGRVYNLWDFPNWNF